MALASGTTPNPAAPDPAPAAPDSGPSQIEAMQARFDAQSRIIAGLQKKIEQIEAVKPAVGATAGEGGAPKKLEGAAALEAIEKRALEREEKAVQKSIRTSIISAMVTNGFTEDAARKLVTPMQNEGKFVVKDDTDEVVVDDGSGQRSASDFVRIILQRDDWRGLIPAKTGAKPVNRGSTAPVQATGNLPQPNAHGVYSAAALRDAAGR